MASLRIVARATLATGFRLAGLPVDEADSPRETVESLERLTREDAGVIFVQQELYDAVPDAQRRRLERAPVPIIVPIPSVRWTADRHAAEEYILDLLQRAIGYRVRLQ